MNYPPLPRLIRTYPWTNAALVFFVVWKFFLVTVLWDGRLIPPEPDDSFTYIAHIASIASCDTSLSCPYPGVSMSDHSGFTYLSYRLILGLVARFVGLSAESIFHASFYIGTLLLIPVMIIFLSTFTRKDGLIALGVFFLALYHGTGETHGFYWVVPSFFSASFFFLLFALVISRTMGLLHWSVVPLAALFHFWHPMGAYVTAIFPLYFLFLGFLSGQVERQGMRRAALVVAIVLCAALGQTGYLAMHNNIDYYGLMETTSEASEVVSSLTANGLLAIPLSTYQLSAAPHTSLWEQKIINLQASFFRFFFPHWFFVLPFCALLFLLYHHGEFRLLALYFSTFVFYLTATLLNEFGFRSAIILWPLTYILFAFGVWYLALLFTRWSRPLGLVLRGILALGVMLFTCLNMFAAYSYNRNINARNNYDFDSRIGTYLLQETGPDARLSLPGTLLRTTTGAQLSQLRKIVPPAASPDFQVLVQPESTRNTVTNSEQVNFLDRLFQIRHETPQPPPIIPEGYNRVATFGDLVVYHREQPSL